MRRSASAPPELPGYRYQRVLGSGGFSDVFLYEQDLPRRQVAVKVLLAEELTAASQRAFVDEANLMAQLSAHPFIVTIYGAALTEDDRPYFVMEYCSGPSLSERYKRAPLPVADTLRTGVRLAGAIATAHSAGILHRDIKPANVLTNDYGWPALTDFGISSAVDELPVHTTTASSLRSEGEASTGATGSTGQSIGLSVPWSPPEMFDDDPRPDVRSDVFSLAATIWTLLAGRTPFELSGRGNGALDLIGRIERGRVTPLERTDVPASLVAVLQKGMATRPEDRWQTAVEFARALQRVELELGYAPTAIDVPAAAIEQHEPADDAPSGPAVDETRVRSVATIEAQPAHPTPRITPPPAEDRADATRLRGVTEVAQPIPEGTVVRSYRPAPDAEIETPPTAPAADAVPEEVAPRRRPRLVTLIALGAVVLVAAVVTVAVVVTGGKVADPDASPTPTGTSAIDDSPVPKPKFLSSSSADGGATVEFRYEPVKSAGGYRWANAADPNTTMAVDGDQPTVVLTGQTPGVQVCVRVIAVRNGRTSDPSVGCYP